MGPTGTVCGERLMGIEISILLIVLGGIFWVKHRRTRSALKAERAAMFDGCIPLFDQHGIRQEGIDYPVLRGRYNGYDFKLQPIVDHVGFRTLPSLWLLVTLVGKTPYRGIFDFLVRPKNTEFYSPASQLEEDIVIPEHWPQHAQLRSDSFELMPPEELIDPHMSFFDDTKAKEMLVTPNGVRMVYQARQADHRYYMLLRQVVFEDLNLSPKLVSDLLDRAISIFRDLVGKTEVRNPKEKEKYHKE
jgi:hypothetical protein